jgi:hypothetical protein
MEENNSGLKLYFGFIIAVTLLCLYSYDVLLKTKHPISTENYSYENLKNPEQIPYINLNGEKIKILGKNYNFELTPQATYKIYAMVMSKSQYYFDWNSKLAKYDLALAWNDLMLPENRVGIKYSQSGRWYYYSFDDKFPLTQAYIIEHSSNVHIVPANQIVLEAISKVRKGDKIYLEGYLVNIDGTVDNKPVWWHSSLSRQDTGDGACEVFYVKKSVLNNFVYQ